MAEHSAKRRRLDVDRVRINLSQKELQRYVLEVAKEPIVFLDKISHWKSLAWTPETLSKQLSDVQTRFRFCPRTSSNSYCFAAKHTVMETDCEFLDGSFEDFCDWLSCDKVKSQKSAFGTFPRQDYSCYADYKYMKDLFLKCPSELEDINWACLGFPTKTGRHSTFWMGSDESFTPCHYDTYGCNLVAQVYGKKKWLLFPPDQDHCLYPTRIPYEESSVFSLVNIRDPDHEKFPNFASASCFEVTLEPGDVLFVPKHWWHYVECLETAISVNIWIEMDTDNYDRIEEAITRALINPLALEGTKSSVDTCNQNPWLNPSMKEEDLSFHKSMHYLRQALKQYHHMDQFQGNVKREELSEEDFINTVVSPDIVRMIAQKLLKVTKATT